MRETEIEYRIKRSVIGVAVGAAVGSLITTIDIHLIVLYGGGMLQDVPLWGGVAAILLCGVGYAGIGRATPSHCDVELAVVCALLVMALETIALWILFLPLLNFPLCSP